MSRTKEVVVNERRELALAELELGEAEGDDILLSTDEGKPVVGLVLSVDRGSPDGSAGFIALLE